MGGTIFPYPGTSARGGLAPGAVEVPFWARGEAAPPKNRVYRSGGGGGPAQGVVGASLRALGEALSAKNGALRPRGGGESSPGGGRSTLPDPRGGIIVQKTGHTGLGGTGSPAQGVVGVPF